MTLAEIWFILIGVLFAGYAIFDGFDLGVGVLYPFFGTSEEDKAVMRRAIGPVWDGNEVWLLTAGGALFAAFPPVYATVFSGFYLALMLVLFALIFRAASLEFRVYDTKWAGFWDGAFFIGSLLPALLSGVAVGNIIRGVPLDAAGEYAGTFFTLLNPYALIIGVTGLVWIVMHGAAWLSVKTTGDLLERSRETRRTAQIIMAIVFAAATASTAVFVPRAFYAAVGSPAGWLFVVLFVAGLVYSWVAGAQKSDRSSFYGSALAGASMVGIWAASIFPNLAPSLPFDEAMSLTVANSSSSDLTLTVMLIIAGIGVPLVLFYFFLIYKTYSGRIEPSSLGREAHY